MTKHVQVNPRTKLLDKPINEEGQLFTEDLNRLRHGQLLRKHVLGGTLIVRYLELENGRLVVEALPQESKPFIQRLTLADIGCEAYDHGWNPENWIEIVICERKVCNNPAYMMHNYDYPHAYCVRCARGINEA